MTAWLQKQWRCRTLWHGVLIPLSWLFFCIILIRRLLYRRGWLKSYRLPVPVVVVGNLNVGGTGKTPLVIWLAEQFVHAGYHPGIISRGYGGETHGVHVVCSDSNPQQVGDEPVLIAKRTRCPVYVGVDRVAAGKALLKAHPECDVVISDDGLQHYRLQRDAELVVADGATGWGNGRLLPAGSLREPVTRLNDVDAVVSNGKWQQDDGLVPVEMTLEAGRFYKLADNSVECDAQALLGKKVLAIAGIGNPERFFQQLAGMGLDFRRRSYPDHYAFQAQDLAAVVEDVVVMTEKDAVKCQLFAHPNFWVLPVQAAIKGDLMATIIKRIGVVNGR